MLKEWDQLPHNQEAAVIGAALQQSPNIFAETTVSTNVGTLTRIGHPPEVHQPLTHTYKKHLFDSPYGAVIHFSGKNYGEDPDYFSRVYHNSKEYYSGNMTLFMPELGPKLLGCDDRTLTLITDKGQSDLSIYFNHSAPDETKAVFEKYFDLMHQIWQKSQVGKIGWPRHFQSLLHPQYSYLIGKNPLDYFLNGAAIAEIYTQTLNSISHFATVLSSQTWSTGFGFEDHKPENTILSQGQIGFVDIAFPSFDYHWLTSLGCSFQSCLVDAPVSDFTKIFKSKMTEVLTDSLSVQLFNLGRMNRLAIPCNSRNAVFMSQIGRPIDSAAILPNLKSLLRLSQSTDPVQALI